MQRIQKLLAQSGIASRRKAELLIREGRVSVNGKVCQLGDSADPEQDTILLDGRPVPTSRPKLYLMLHKPRGFVTTLSDDRGRRTVAELVSDCGERVFPVGRLDYDSEGLLFMTNDGYFADRLMHPRHQVSKVYRVLVSGYTEQGLLQLKKPIVLDGYTIAPPKVTLVRAGDPAQLEITIHEGRNRQIRRMCEAAQMQVKRLKRISEDGVALGQLPPGKWRHLEQKELRLLGLDI